MKDDYQIKTRGKVTITIPVNSTIEKVIFTSQDGSIEFSEESLRELIRSRIDDRDENI